MKGTMSVDTITFKNGSSLKLQENSIVVFVGPNNAGKSLTLRELNQVISLDNRPMDSNFIIKSATLKRNGSEADVLEFLKPRLTHNDQYALSQNNMAGTSFSLDQIKQAWNPIEPTNNHPIMSANITGFFVKKLETQDRLTLVQPAPNLGFNSNAKTHPIQMLKDDEEIELGLSKLFKRAFSQELIVNHDAGANTPLHVGKRPESTKEQDRVSREYMQQLQQLGQLHTQGDGMKSFSGVLLSLFAESYSINIIDEPEAFLHPPQAKLLGEMLAAKLDKDKQLFVATHSEHFLKGILSHGENRLIVVRLERDESGTIHTVLNNESIKKVWKDPILKHSNVLDGLFHSKVILTESDGDSRFFSAIASAIVDEADIKAPDVHYVHSGGKHRFLVIVESMKKLNVPMKVIADFDILNAKSPLKDVYVALGGNWDIIERDFNIVKTDIDQQRPELSSEDLKKEIALILNKITDSVITDENIKELSAVIKKASAWGVAKRIGKDLLRAGNPQQSYERMNQELEKAGLIVLQVGEIEAFDKTVGNHGPKWVNDVLEKDLKNDPSLEKARKFVENFIIQ